jgi:hypothetical protein
LFFLIFFMHLFGPQETEYQQQVVTATVATAAGDLAAVPASLVNLTDAGAAERGVEGGMDLREEPSMQPQEASERRGPRERAEAGGVLCGSSEDQVDNGQADIQTDGQTDRHLCKQASRCLAIFFHFTISAYCTQSLAAKEEDGCLV